MKSMLEKKVFLWLGLLGCILLLGIGGCGGATVHPRARHGGQMVYDNLNQQVLLFGGRGNGGVAGDLLDDLWSLDLDTQKWQRIDTSAGPDARLSPGLAYDPSHQQLILFGGYGTSGRVNDTWLLDLETLAWKEIFPIVSPPARSDAGMDFDEKNQVVVLFGGYCLEFERELCNDTWSFDPGTNDWVEMEPVSSPPVMYGLSLDYDPRGQTMLLFGGHMSQFTQNGAASAGYNDSVWSYSYQENTWEEFPRESFNSPSKRYWHQAAYLTAESGLFVFGGDNGQRYQSDSWLFDLAPNSWSRLRPEGTPPGRIVGAMVYSPDHNQLVLFGGLDNDFDNLDDTWIYSVLTDTWEQVLP